MESIKLSGWRSVSSDHPIEINELKSVNLLVGPNNVGKSNIGRFLVKLREVFTANYSTHRDWFREYRPEHFLSIEFPSGESDYWLHRWGDIEAELAFTAKELKAENVFPEDNFDKNLIKFKISIITKERKGILSITPLTKGGIPLITIDKGNTLFIDAAGKRVQFAESLHSGTPHLCGAGYACHRIASSVIEIRALRSTIRADGTPASRSTSGGDIIYALGNAQADQNNRAFWSQFRRDINRWFSVILGEKKVEFRIVNSQFVIDLERNGEELSCELNDLGSGVAQLLMILAYLRLQPEKDYIVIIDEPEAHLHPSAAVALAKIIAENLPSHQTIFTTHSTSLIDAITEKWRAFRVWRGSHGGTEAEPLGTTRSELALLADLGISPSQIFMAKSVLWVEGPSDINYWTAMLESVAPSLISGRDYAFIIYGGASASHLYIETDSSPDESIERLVKVMKVSHKSIIICDKDAPETSKDRPTIARLKLAAEQIKDNVKIVESIGREMENSITDFALNYGLEQVRPKYLLDPKKIELTYLEYIVKDDDNFNVIVANSARHQDGSILPPEQVNKIKELLNQRKTRLSSIIKEYSKSNTAFKERAISKANEVADWMTKA